MIGARMFRRLACQSAALLLPLTGLCACDGGTKEPDPAANERGNTTTAVVLPPSIRKTTGYRCKDKSIVSIDFLDDDRTINLRDDGGISQFRAAKPGGPYDSGYNDSGGMTVVVKGNDISIEQGGKEIRQCKS
ncbi:hypothetical protein [Sphingobium aquiterrae]|uniref:hypothetical protein n=1 Tax=Sphingobium aquiterrae TaxID=2038656 RepID=UPI0030193783